METHAHVTICYTHKETVGEAYSLWRSVLDHVSCMDLKVYMHKLCKHTQITFIVMYFFYYIYFLSESNYGNLIKVWIEC